LNDGVGAGGRLPRGRHKLPRAEVKANQRRRLLTAATVALGEHGYTALTVDLVIEGAGVSRATFYEQFADKQECVLAAHSAAFEQLFDAVAQACTPDQGWAQGVAAGIEALLEFAAVKPDEARLVVETYPAASDPPLAAHGMVTHQRLANLLSPGRAGKAGTPAMPDLTERAVIGAVMSVVGAMVMAGEAERLPELRAELTRLVLTPYLGETDARDLAVASDPAGELEECQAS
jgi:AcrR family transcriptional regulator